MPSLRRPASGDASCLTKAPLTAPNQPQGHFHAHYRRFIRRHPPRPNQRRPHKPALMLWPSGSSSLHVWDHLAPRLAQTFHVLRFDIRGVGQSTPAAAPTTDQYTFEQYAKDACQVPGPPRYRRLPRLVPILGRPSRHRLLRPPPRASPLRRLLRRQHRPPRRPRPTRRYPPSRRTPPSRRHPSAPNPRRHRQPQRPNQRPPSHAGVAQIRPRPPSSPNSPCPS